MEKEEEEALSQKKIVSTGGRGRRLPPARLMAAVPPILRSNEKAEVAIRFNPERNLSLYRTERNEKLSMIVLRFSHVSKCQIFDQFIAPLVGLIVKLTSPKVHCISDTPCVGCITSATGHTKQTATAEAEQTQEISVMQWNFLDASLLISHAGHVKLDK